MPLTAQRSTASVRTTSPVLVGRSRELEVLVRAVSRAPSATFVEGEAGVGKTRLIGELAHVPPTRALPRAVACCHPLGEPFPYGPVFDALRSCAGRFGGRTLSAVTGALVPYLPELSDVLPPAPVPLPEPAAQRHRLFRAVRELIGAMGRLVLVVEDVHWADRGTRELLRFVLADPPPGLSLVVSYRREDLPEGLAPLGSAFRPDPVVSSAQIVLGPLDVEGVRGLTGAILEGRPVSTEFAAAVHQCSAGLPFVVEETLHTLRDPLGSLRTGPPASSRLLETLEVPILLRQAMLERLAGIPRTARDLAEVAAVLGEPATADVLGTVSGVPLARTRTGLIRLLKAGVLVEVDERRYGYRHPLAQRTVYEALPGPRREELHRRAVAELARMRPRPLVRLAEHSRRAGLVDDWLRYSEQAAESASTDGNVATAVELLRTVLVDPSVPSRALDRLATRFCRLALTGLHQTEVTATMERLISDPRLSPGVRGEVRLGLGLVQVRQSTGLETGRALVEQAIGDLAGRPDLASRGMAMLAMPYMGGTPVSDHLDWLRKVEEAIDRGEPGPVRTALLANTLGSRVHLGDRDAWARFDLLPTTAAAGAEEHRQLARAHANLADACSWVGHYRKARQLLWSGLRIASECGAPFIVGTAEATRLRLDWLAGEWTGLDDKAAEFFKVYDGLDPVTCELSLVRAWLAAAQGEWETAEELLIHTGAFTPESSFAPVSIAGMGCLVGLHVDREEYDKAAENADRGAEFLRHKGVWPWAGELALPAVDAYVGSGRSASARRLVDDLARGIASLDAPLASAALTACRGVLSIASGDTEPGVKALLRARKGFEELGLPYRAAQITERIQACREAVDGLGDLATWFEQLGATRDAARCRHRLRKSGADLRSRRGRRGYGNALSPRELEVARLIASGHTNREIADVLFLSRRTVEQHVSSVLRKSGLTSRHQLAST